MHGAESSVATAPPPPRITASRLGSAAFRRDYGVRYAYVAGAMYKGIASTQMVSALGRAGLIGFLGTGGLDLDEIESGVQALRQDVGQLPWGVNLLSALDRPELETRTVELYLRADVRFVEAAAFVQMSRALVWLRVTGLRRRPDGVVIAPRHVIAKVSRPEVAARFMAPPPAAILRDLVASRHVTPAEAEMSESVPMAGDICIEADSGGHTDGGVAYALMPSIAALRDEMMARHRYATPIRLGAAGGIGTPAAAAAAFVMGADFVLTGSINQCTVEAGMSDAVKDLLQDINVQDTAYAPAGDMFESGARVQVLKKRVFFPARANRLYELYQRHGSLEELGPEVRKQIEEKYFDRSFDEVWEETERHYRATDPKRLDECQTNPKRKMALIFKWYFVHSARLAREGSSRQQVDYQVHCGPALGAFNQWVKGTPLESWRNRRVSDLGERIMTGAAELLERRLREMERAE